MGEPAFLSEEFLQNQDPDVELVTTSGYGKNGALCVLQRSVRPQVNDMRLISDAHNSVVRVKIYSVGSHNYMIDMCIHTHTHLRIF